MSFVTDTFTDTDSTALTSHTGETGATWTKHTSYGAATIGTIQSNRLRSGDVTNDICVYASGSPATAEYDVQCDLVAMGAVTNTFSGPAGRIDTAANTMYLVQSRIAAAQHRLFKGVTGTFTQLGSFTATLASCTVMLQIRDAAKKMFLNGVEQISSADNAITAAGKAGLRMKDDVSNSSGCHIDNFSATDAGGASGGPWPWFTDNELSGGLQHLGM